ncbi:OsmC family protein [Pedobacter jamesrossensis]|uniref:OsmC family protein n=1 Tax=Pedobacter jamesrossensis TaxID=1908238 RepID=A0ABV8NI19_9SPHI
MATKLNITNFPTGYQSLITNGKHAIVGDEPLNSKGTDLGFSPPELLLSGIAMCKAATVRFIARKNGWEIGNVDAELTQETKRGEDGRLSTKIATAISIEGDLSEEQKKELLAQADRCYVVRMIEGDWEIEHATEMKKEVAA